MSRNYNMKSDPHGICLIFNNHFKRVKRRSGTDKDCGSLENLFKTLRYVVRIEKDKSGPEMLSILKEINSDEGNKDHDSFVCCLLSHGNLDGIYGNDNNSILRYVDIWSLFGEKKSMLQKKPKIFIVQSCQRQVKRKSSVLEEDLKNEAKRISLDKISTNDKENNFNDIYANNGYITKHEIELDFNQGRETDHGDILFVKCAVPGKCDIFTLIFTLDMSKYMNYSMHVYKMFTSMHAC